MNASIRTWLAVSASIAAAALVMAAPAAARDIEYTPFVTDFPRAVAAGGRSGDTEYTPFVTDFPRAVAARERSTSGGFDWRLASGLAVGAGLVALVALRLTRRPTRTAAHHHFKEPKGAAAPLR